MQGSPRSKANSKAQHEELFDYLAYNGVKSQKAAIMDQIKAQKELEGCTFKPQIINYDRPKNGKPIYESLANMKKDANMYEQAKIYQELKHCTFQPKIDRKSSKIANKDLTGTKSYEILHQKHMKQKERAQRLLREKQDKELGECTFKPTLVSKQQRPPRRDNADIADSPQKINMPSESTIQKTGRHMTTESDFFQDSEDRTRKTKKDRQAMNQDTSPLTNQYKHRF